MQMKTVVHGYKLNNYNATYVPRDFIFNEVVEGKNRTIKVIDSESGEEFWFNAPIMVETPKRKA